MQNYAFNKGLSRRSRWPDIFRIMKLIMALLTIGFVQVSATTLAQRVTYKQTGATLEHLIEAIQRQTGYRVLYSPDQLDERQQVDVSYANVALPVLLEDLARRFSLTYSVEGKDISLRVGNAPATTGSPLILAFSEVYGKIVDSTGVALSGASIRVLDAQGKRTTLQSQSDRHGDFVLHNVPEDAILEISYVGFISQRINVQPHIGVIVLKALPSTLQEVEINAGYYTVTDRERTGSIARVSAEDIENQPVINVLSAVQGRMAGVNIRQISGTAGGGFDIEIRGRNSLRTRVNSGIDGNLPMYVIDGVPIGSAVNVRYGGTGVPNASINPLNGLNLNDIESIEILKDADATAIYGSRGANGVILITTKQGKPGSIGLSVNTTYGVSQARSSLKMMNTEQYLAMRKQAFANSGVTSYPATAYDVNGDWDQSRYTNWRDELIGNDAAFSRVQASLTGGNEFTTFLVSLGHDQQTTVFTKDFKYKTSSVAANVNHRSRDNRFQLNLSNRFSLQGNNVIASDITGRSFTLAPNAPALYQADGSLNWENNTFENPVAAYDATYSNDTYTYLSNLTAQYELLPGLQAKVNGGIQYFAFEEWQLSPHTSISIYRPTNGLTSAYSQSYKSNHGRFSYILEPQLTWRIQQAAHQLDALVGGTYQQEDNAQGSMSGTGFQSNVFIKNIAAATTKTINDQITTEYKYAAVFGRLNYQYASRYILNVTGRRDGSSRFGPNKRFATFGAVGAAWLFGDEDFARDLPWLSFGKLRASYGSTGSDAIGDNQYLDTYTISTLIYSGITGINPSRLYNPDYSWEKTVKLESALEIALFEDRLRVNAAWYRNRSSSQLVGYQLPAITGFPSVMANLNATVQNTGWEIELEASPIAHGAVRWDASANISFPGNKLVAFPGLEGSTYANSYLIGYPVTITKLYQLEGVDAQTGQYVFTDFNQDGQISSPDDRQLIENIGVSAFGGLSNSLQYQNWSLSFLFQFVQQKSRNYNYSLASPGLMVNMPVEVLNVWSPENPGGVYAPYRSTANPMHSRFQISDAAVSDASFVRLKNVDLSYRLPLKRSAVKSISMYFQGQNLVTWSRFFGVDPETGINSFLPPLRSYTVGAQFNF